MILKKLNCFLMFFFMTVHGYAFSESIVLPRVLMPESSQIAIEKGDYYSRQLKRQVVKVSTIAGIVTMMYITYNASKYFKELDKQIYDVDRRVRSVENVVTVIELEKNIKDVDEIEKVDASTKLQFLNGFNPIKIAKKAVGSGIGSTKNFVTDIGKCIVEAFPTFITGMIFSTLWQQVCNRIVASSKQETLSWYIENHTTLWLLFHDLTLGCIPYDIYSELLSLQQVHDKCTGQMNAYVSDLSELNQKNDELSTDEAYLNHVSCDIKKNSLKMVSELAQLQNYTVPNIAKRKRAINQGLQGASLFQDTEMGKQNIVDLCTMLTVQIQKILAFIIMRIDARRLAISATTIQRGKKKIDQIIIASNKYFDQMEKLLNMSDDQLESMSIINQGMFTCTYEFERLFKEHIAILHRYCALID